MHYNPTAAAGGIGRHGRRATPEVVGPRESGSQPDGPQLVIVARASQAWVQQSAGICPKSRRDGFARDCPLRHPVAWVLALRDRSGAHRRFLVVCGAISAVVGEAPEKRGTTEARWQPVCRRSSRELGFVVRGGRSRDTRPRKADGGSDRRPAECCRPGESARGMDPSYIPRMSRIKFLIGLAEGLLGGPARRSPGDPPVAPAHHSRPAPIPTTMTVHAVWSFSPNFPERQASMTVRSCHP